MQMEALKHSPSSSSNSSHSSSSLINSGSRTSCMQPVSLKSQHSTIGISKFSFWIFVPFMTNKTTSRSCRDRFSWSYIKCANERIVFRISIYVYIYRHAHWIKQATAYFCWMKTEFQMQCACSVCVVASVTLNSVDLHICKLRSLSSQVNFLFFLFVKFIQFEFVKLFEIFSRLKCEVQFIHEKNCFKLQMERNQLIS